MEKVKKMRLKKMFRQGHNYKDLMMGACVGSALGALTALLFSTQEGKKLQKSLKHTFEDLVHPPLLKRKMSRVKKKLRKKTK